MNTQFLSRTTLMLAMLSLLQACTSVPLEPEVYPDDPDYAPVSAESLQPPPMANGSLFQARYSFGLYTDQQARRVGDIITVIFDSWHPPRATPVAVPAELPPGPRAARVRSRAGWAWTAEGAWTRRTWAEELQPTTRVSRIRRRTPCRPGPARHMQDR